MQNFSSTCTYRNMWSTCLILTIFKRHAAYKWNYTMAITPPWQIATRVELLLDLKLSLFHFENLSLNNWQLPYKPSVYHMILWTCAMSICLLKDMCLSIFLSEGLNSNVAPAHGGILLRMHKCANNPCVIKSRNIVNMKQMVFMHDMILMGHTWSLKIHTCHYHSHTRCLIPHLSIYSRI